MEIANEITLYGDPISVDDYMHYRGLFTAEREIKEEKFRAMELSKKVVYSMLEFLNEEYNDQETSPERKESLEVASQCLETAFGITLQDTGYKSSKTLRGMLQEQEVASSIPPGACGEGAGLAGGPRGPYAFMSDGLNYQVPTAEVSEASKAMAEEMKNKGNDAMRSGNYNEALTSYTCAIELDGRNAVYFCNRAAAFLKLEKLDESLMDCKIAVMLQPSYARAYGRMGVTYATRNEQVEAVFCFRKALELEPTNESYSSNLRLSQESLSNIVTERAGGVTGDVAPGMDDLISNPNLINMASQMLRDPNMHNMIQNLMGQFAGGGGMPGVGAGAPGQGHPLQNLMQMGQTIANQIRTTNPDLAEALGVGAVPTSMDFSNPGDSNNSDSPPES